MSDLRGVIDDVLINHVVSRKRGVCDCGHVFQLGESFTAHHTDLILAALRVSPSLVPWLEDEGIVTRVGRVGHANGFHNEWPTCNDSRCQPVYRVAAPRVSVESPEDGS